MKVPYAAVSLAFLTSLATGSHSPYSSGPSVSLSGSAAAGESTESPVEKISFTGESTQPCLGEDQSSDDPAEQAGPKDIAEAVQSQVPEESAQILQIRKELEEGLPAAVVERLSSELSGLELNQMKELNGLFCKEGKCMPSTVTLFTEHCERAAKEGRDVVECAKGLLSTLREYFKPQEEVEMDEPSYPDGLDNAAAWEKVRCEIGYAINDNELERVVTYFLLFDERAERKAIKARLLITAAERVTGRQPREPPELWNEWDESIPEDRLFNYWEAQDRALLLGFYRKSLTDKYWDLAVLHPNIFIESSYGDHLLYGECDEKTYGPAFQGHLDSLLRRKVISYPLWSYFNRISFPATAKILRNLVGKMLRPQDVHKALALQVAVLKTRLQQPDPSDIAEQGRLQRKVNELTYEMAHSGIYYLPNLPHLFFGKWAKDLEANEVEDLEELKRTAENLDFQVLQLELGPIKAREDPFFPYNRVEKHIIKPITGKVAFGEYIGVYDATRQHLVENVFRMPSLHFWANCRPRRTDALVGIFWQILNFLLKKEESRQHGSCFGWLILAQDNVQMRDKFSKLAPNGLEELVQELLAGSDEDCYEKLDSLTAQLIGLYTPGHPFSADDFSQIRENLDLRGLFYDFLKTPSRSMPVNPEKMVGLKMRLDKLREIIVTRQK